MSQLPSPAPAPSARRLPPTGLMLDAFWRAAAYCLLPKVIVLSLLPLLLAVVVLGGLSWWGWSDAVSAIRAWLDHWALSQTLLGWLDAVGFGHFRAVVAPMLLVLVAVPVVVVLCLLLVAAFMVPAITKLVQERRFAGLESRHVASVWQSLAWSTVSSVLALAVMALSMPLWLIPLVALVLPPVIWGWLTYRVMVFDVLADLATPEEREAILRDHRGPLLVMGVVSGYLGAAPAALWAIGALAVVFAPFLLLASVWVYTLVFAFAAAWFAHYLLAVLQVRRSAS